MYVYKLIVVYINRAQLSCRLTLISFPSFFKYNGNKVDSDIQIGGFTLNGIFKSFVKQSKIRPSVHRIQSNKRLRNNDRGKLEAASRSDSTQLHTLKIIQL